MKATCACCGKEFPVPPAKAEAFAKAAADGRPVWCGRACRVRWAQAQRELDAMDAHSEGPTLRIRGLD